MLKNTNEQQKIYDALYVYILLL